MRGGNPGLPLGDQCQKPPLQQKEEARTPVVGQGWGSSHPGILGTPRIWSVPTQSNGLKLPAKEALQYHPQNQENRGGGLLPQSAWVGGHWVGGPLSPPWSVPSSDMSSWV